MRQEIKELAQRSNIFVTERSNETFCGDAQGHAHLKSSQLDEKINKKKKKNSASTELNITGLQLHAGVTAGTGSHLFHSMTEACDGL